MRRVIHFGFVALAISFLGGCAEPIAEAPLPPPVPYTTYRTTVHEVYGSDEPIALMTFERDANGNPTRGTTLGIIHGWPFPHNEPSGDPGEGLFTYRTDFIVTRISQDKLPEAAEGIRTIYFHADRAAISLEQPASISSGQPIIHDSVRLLFSFSASGSVEIAITSHQTGTEAFVWNGEKILPPSEPPETGMETASYSARYSGYLFR
ncbi:MAG: hypothetical protein ACLQAT_29585 [Candidatus Binataceae bacterium]